MPDLKLTQLVPPTPAAGCGIDAEGSPLGDPSAHTGNGPSVYLETFGCQMNVLDSQLVVSQLRGLGYRFTDDWKSADVVLYNTCSVREQAENKVWSRVGLVGKHKRERPGVVLGVIGCMAERDGTDMIKRHPQIDLLCGPGELDKVPMLIDNAFKTKAAIAPHVNAEPDAEIIQSAAPHPHAGPQTVALQGNTHRRSATLSAASDKLELIDLSRSFNASDASLPGEHLPGAGRSAYVRITRGCNKLCTYCVVPNTRGAEVHRHPDHIVDEVKKLADHGVIEVTLLGQTVNHYHYDHSAAQQIDGVWQPQVGTVISPNKGTGGPSPSFNDSTTSFADLLHRVHEEVPAIQRLRFVTSLPRDFGDDILQVIADSPRICRYLHLPVQSGSNRVLAKMNRGYRVEQYRELIERAKAMIPGVTLATDIIVGFPGETDADYQQTRDLLAFARYKNSFIFKYSPRPGTAAYDRLPEDVPDEVKRHRNNDLLALQAQISQEIHDGYVGQTVDVFVEGVSQKTRKATALTSRDREGAVGLEESASGSGPLPDGRGSSSPDGRGSSSQSDETMQLSGRTDGDLITFFDGDPSLIGSIVKVKVEAALPLALAGVLR
ncbi:MAG: MiaB/RimO family radical SAM methylthiotransferase [Phycisphaeraceae bacterium]